MKYTVEEYADMDFQKITECIEPDSINKAKETAPARANRINGENTEFSILDEMMSRFDVLFKAVNPNLSKDETMYYLHIDMELQNTMSLIGMTNIQNSKEMNLQKETYDLMSMVILRLGNPKYDSVEDIFKIQNALFYPRKEKAYQVLKEYVDFSETLT